jgi:trk system potassium uptake protein TrkH
VGTLLVILDETIGGYVLSNLGIVNGGWLAFFSVVSSRTAGITLVPIEQFGSASQLVLFVWMFIGGAPASMGGGVGLSTVAVVLLTLASNARGHADVRIMERTFPTETIVKAVAVLTVSTTVVICVTFLLTLIEDIPLFSLAFEVVSAYSNTGYSMDVTGNLGGVSRILIALTMFWGRLGPLTLVVALAQRSHPTLIRYPEEKILIG